MRNTVSIFLLILCSQTIFAQAQRFKSVIDNLPNSVTQHIPAGYCAIDTAIGDLNNDPFPDMLLVLANKNEEALAIENDSSKNIRRPLLLLIGSSDGEYKLAARNDNIVYDIVSGGVMGDPFVGITLKNGYFSIEHYGGSAWRWDHIITFKYSKQKKYWYLHKESKSTFNINFMNEDSSIDSQIKWIFTTTKDFGVVRYDQYENRKEYQKPSWLK